MRAHPSLFWQIVAALVVGGVAAGSLLGSELHALPGSLMLTLLAAVALLAGGIAAFMVHCVCRDPDRDWMEAFPRGPVVAGSDHDISVVG